MDLRDEYNLFYKFYCYEWTVKNISFLSGSLESLPLPIGEENKHQLTITLNLATENIIEIELKIVSNDDNIKENCFNIAALDEFRNVLESDHGSMLKENKMNTIGQKLSSDVQVNSSSECEQSQSFSENEHSLFEDEGSSLLFDDEQNQCLYENVHSQTSFDDEQIQSLSWNKLTKCVQEEEKTVIPDICHKEKIVYNNSDVLHNEEKYKIAFIDDAYELQRPDIKKLDRKLKNVTENFSTSGEMKIKDEFYTKNIEPDLKDCKAVSKEDKISSNESQEIKINDEEPNTVIEFKTENKLKPSPMFHFSDVIFQKIILKERVKFRFDKCIFKNTISIQCAVGLKFKMLPIPNLIFRDFISNDYEEQLSLSNLSKDIEKLFQESMKFTDIDLQMNCNNLKAHKAVLSCRCPFLLFNSKHCPEDSKELYAVKNDSNTLQFCLESIHLNDLTSPSSEYLLKDYAFKLFEDSIFTDENIGEKEGSSKSFNGIKSLNSDELRNYFKSPILKKKTKTTQVARGIHSGFKKHLKPKPSEDMLETQNAERIQKDPTDSQDYRKSKQLHSTISKTTSVSNASTELNCVASEKFSFPMNTLDSNFNHPINEIGEQSSNSADRISDVTTESNSKDMKLAENIRKFSNVSQKTSAIKDFFNKQNYLDTENNSKCLNSTTEKQKFSNEFSSKTTGIDDIQNDSLNILPQGATLYSILEETTTDFSHSKNNHLKGLQTAANCQTKNSETESQCFEQISSTDFSKSCGKDQNYLLEEGNIKELLLNPQSRFNTHGSFSKYAISETIPPSSFNNDDQKETRRNHTWFPGVMEKPLKTATIPPSSFNNDDLKETTRNHTWFPGVMEKPLKTATITPSSFNNDGQKETTRNHTWFPGVMEKPLKTGSYSGAKDNISPVKEICFDRNNADFRLDSEKELKITNNAENSDFLHNFLASPETPINASNDREWDFESNLRHSEDMDILSGTSKPKTKLCASTMIDNDLFSNEYENNLCDLNLDSKNELLNTKNVFPSCCTTNNDNPNSKAQVFSSTSLSGSNAEKEDYNSLKCDSTSGETNILHMKNVDPHAFYWILRYIYSGRIDINNPFLFMFTCFRVYVYAKKFGLKQLARILAPITMTVQSSIKTEKCSFISIADQCKPGIFYKSPNYVTSKSKKKLNLFLRYENSNIIVLTLIGVNEICVQYKFNLVLYEKNNSHKIKIDTQLYTPRTGQCSAPEANINLSELGTEAANIKSMTVYCSLNIYSNHSVDDSEIIYPFLKAESNTGNLSKDLRTLFESKKFSDVRLRAGDMTFDAHKFILAARSATFASLFKISTESEFDLENIDGSTLESLLIFIYSGKIDDWKKNHLLYEAAIRYKIEDLSQLCRSYLKNNFSDPNVCDVLIIAHKSGDLDLFNSAKSYVCKNASKVLLTPSGLNLMTNHANIAKEILEEMSTLK